MRGCVTRLRDETPRAAVIVTPKLDKIDGNDKPFHRPKAGRDSAGGRPAGAKNPHLWRGLASLPGHGWAFQPRAEPALVGGYGVCFLGLGGNRRLGLCPRVCQVPFRACRFRPGGAGYLFHSFIRMVRAKLVLAGEEERITTNHGGPSARCGAVLNSMNHKGHEVTRTKQPRFPLCSLESFVVKSGHRCSGCSYDGKENRGR